jgi:hypothetical protein
MSISPRSSTPSGETTCALPRALSSEPVPVACGQLCVYAGVGAAAAFFRWTRPLPCATGSATGRLVAVEVSSFFT